MLVREMKQVYGYINGKAVYSRDEFIFEARGFGPIANDADIIDFAEKVTSRWYNAGHHHTFSTYYLGGYCLDEPYRSLTKAEYERLKELQVECIALKKRIDEAREWKFVRRVNWADNSVEETWVDKNGAEKSVMVTQPHGDIC